MIEALQQWKAWKTFLDIQCVKKMSLPFLLQAKSIFPIERGNTGHHWSNLTSCLGAAPNDAEMSQTAKSPKCQEGEPDTICVIFGLSCSLQAQGWWTETHQRLTTGLPHRRLQCYCRSTASVYCPSEWGLWVILAGGAVIKWKITVTIWWIKFKVNVVNEDDIDRETVIAVGIFWLLPCKRYETDFLRCCHGVRMWLTFPLVTMLYKRFLHISIYFTANLCNSEQCFEANASESADRQNILLTSHCQGSICCISGILISWLYSCEWMWQWAQVWPRSHRGSVHLAAARQQPDRQTDSDVWAGTRWETNTPEISLSLLYQLFTSRCMAGQQNTLICAYVCAHTQIGPCGKKKEPHRVSKRNTSNGCWICCESAVLIRWLIDIG